MQASVRLLMSEVVARTGLNDQIRCELSLRDTGLMAEGTIKRLTDKGFGFIDTGEGKDMFFHMSALEGVRYDELQEGQRVEYNPGEGPKGPRAENVRVV